MIIVSYVLTADSHCLAVLFRCFPNLIHWRIQTPQLGDQLSTHFPSDLLLPFPYPSPPLRLTLPPPSPWK